MKQIAKTLESVEIPKELQFFYCGKTLGLDSESGKFAKFLLLDECTLVIGRKKCGCIFKQEIYISIIEIEKKAFTTFYAQQDYDKNLFKNFWCRL